MCAGQWCAGHHVCKSYVTMIWDLKDTIVLQRVPEDARNPVNWIQIQVMARIHIQAARWSPGGPVLYWFTFISILWGSLVKERTLASTLCFPHSVSQPSSLALQPLLPTLKSAMPVRRNGSNAWVHPLLSSPVRLGIFVCFYIICHFSSWRQWQGWLVQIACAMQEMGALIYLMLLKHLQITKQISSFYLFQRD